ncbi:hypothetical protein B2I21_36170 [Chryseobacterium mucoviscidosis]|nr:hypothetical protein B2I21_36170 [Chryseobacterium mucoviscidosis]
MKKYLLMVFLVFILAGCTNDQNSNESTNSGSNGSDETKIEELQNENARLKEQLDNSQGETNNEALSETLNLTFKLISAMGSKDYEFIESVSSPNVEVSRENNNITLKDENDGFEVAFLNNINLENLEFRGFDLTDETHAQLFMAEIRTAKGSEGNTALNFDFVRSEDGRWLLEKFLTN